MDALAIPIVLALGLIAALFLGARAALSARRRSDATGLAERAAAYLRERLHDDFVVLAQYAPRDDSADTVPVVVVGPTGVVVVEPRDEPGELVCYQDHWYRRVTNDRSRALRDSPSRRARWNATRVRSDVATGGFIHTSVDAVVVFTRGELGDVASSCVPVCGGLAELVSYLQRHGTPAQPSPERTRALAEALVGPIRLATA